jgi:hypothetical protein
MPGMLCFVLSYCLFGSDSKLAGFAEMAQQLQICAQLSPFKHEAVIFRKNSLYLVISTVKTDVYGNNFSTR